MPSVRRPLLASGVLVAVLALAVAACGSDDADGISAAPTTSQTAPAPPVGAEPTDPTDAGAVQVDPQATAVAPPPASAAPVQPADGVEAVLAAMTLDQKVGQVLATTVIGADATQVSAEAAAANTALYGVATPAEVVARYHLGGVAYFDHDQGPGTSNVDDLTATAALSAGLQRAAAADTGIGLLVGADQEGGRVVRLREPAIVFPAAQAIGTTGRVDLAEQVGQVTARQALAVGVNWVYAPVADVALDPANQVIGDRAFAADTATATDFAAATARGLAAGGVLPTFKHFPGHGDTGVDSHTSLPTIDHDLATLTSVDLPPFATATALAEQGVSTSVMVGHLAVPAVDPSGRPATISAPILDLLRGGATGGGATGLGFDGLVVTDAMNMGALSGFGDAGSLAVQSLAAGVDVVLMPTDLPAAFAAIRAAAEDGSLPMARLDQAVRRVLQAKSDLGILDAAAIPTPDPSALGAPEAQAVRDAIRAVCGC